MGIIVVESGFNMSTAESRKKQEIEQEYVAQVCEHGFVLFPTRLYQLLRIDSNEAPKLWVVHA